VGRGSRVRNRSELGRRQRDITRGRATSRVCVTLDADFHPLLATSGERGPSLIRIRKEGLGATALAALLQTIWPRVEDALDTGVLMTIAERSIRVRGLN
jgi:predicted nuclease of predicted toxin-antitoxin system